MKKSWEEKRRKKPLVDVGTSQNKQWAFLASSPGDQLGQEIAKDHAWPRLDVLQGQILLVRPSKHLELWRLGSESGKDRQKPGNDAINVGVNVVAA